MRWSNWICIIVSWIIPEWAIEYQPSLQIDEGACSKPNWKVRRNGSYADLWDEQNYPTQSSWRSTIPSVWWKILHRLINAWYINSLGIHKSNGDLLHIKSVEQALSPCSKYGRLENEEAVQHIIPYMEVMHSLKRIRWDAIFRICKYYHFIGNYIYCNSNRKSVQYLDLLHWRFNYQLTWADW